MRALTFFSSRINSESKSDYQNINPYVDADNVKDQAANYWMSDIRGFRFIHSVSSFSNTQMMLSFIKNALAAPGVQENTFLLDEIHGYLTQIEDRVSYYTSHKSDGFYKQVFWSASPAQLKELANQTQEYFGQIDTCRTKIAINDSSDYQRKGLRRGADSAV